VHQRSEYDLLLDAIIPLERYRADLTNWDGGLWGRALHAAAWHRLSPALFLHLEDRNGAPLAVINALERAYLANSARMLFVRQSIDRVVRTLATASIPSLLLKGAALVETIYPDPALREMLDIDVLVPAARIGAATEALAAIGYASAESGCATSQNPAQPIVAPLHDLPLVGSERLVAVELHRHITIDPEGRSFEMDGFWDRARTLDGSGHLAPAPEDLLLHVCLHFTRNRLGGGYEQRSTGGALAQLLDIGRIVDREPIDWDAFTSRARSYRLGKRVFLALFAARELGVPVPRRPLAELEPIGFDPQLGRRLVALRVLRADDRLPVRSLRWMFAPSREVLSRGWNADPTAALSLARAYMRRARAYLPAASASAHPIWLLRDRRLNSQVESLGEPA
jgi:hypothetical protein